MEDLFLEDIVQSYLLKNPFFIIEKNINIKNLIQEDIDILFIENSIDLREIITWNLEQLNTLCIVFSTSREQAFIPFKPNVKVLPKKISYSVFYNKFSSIVDEFNQLSY